MAEETLLAIIRHFTVSEEDRARIAKLDQRSAEWLEARRFRLSGSIFAAALGHNPYQGQEDVAISLLWPTFKGNEATQWGNEHEDEACAMYECYMRQRYPDFQVHHAGFLIHDQLPFIGVSPDGLCEYWDEAQGKRVKCLLEIKCPYRWKKDRFYDPIVPLYYYDQLQGLMGFLNLPFSHFVVWTPMGLQINVVKFDKHYFQSVLRPGLIDFYVDLFYPALCLFLENKLPIGELKCPMEIDIVPTKAIQT